MGITQRYAICNKKIREYLKFLFSEVKKNVGFAAPYIRDFTPKKSFTASQRVRLGYDYQRKTV